MVRLWRWVLTLAAVERRLLLVGVTLTAIGLGALGIRTWKAATVSIPVSGGALVEGFVGTKTELEQTVEQLTKAGLVFQDVGGNFQPLLSRSWEIKDNGRAYTFLLRAGVPASGIVAVTKDRADLFFAVTAEAPNDETVVFRLKQPYGPFLSILSLPLFPGGPFQIAEQGSERMSFTRNESFAPGPPHLGHLTIQLFENEQELGKAVSRGDVGMASPRVSSSSQFTTFTIFLPRRHAVFLNVAEEPFNDTAVREKIVRKEKFDKPFQVTLTTSIANKARAEAVEKEWQGIGVQVTLFVMDEPTLRKTIIPDRNYQALLYGWDAGVDPDPYRFWHSSQAKKGGLNLTNVKDAELDRLLDDARRTTDEAARSQKYAEIEQVTEKTFTVIVLENINFPFQVDRRIKGVRNIQGVDVGSRYSQVWDWYSRERRALKR